MRRPVFPISANLAGQGAHRSEPLPAEPLPEGLAYREEVVSAEEERVLAEQFALLPLTSLGFRGLLGWRRVVSCGWRYGQGRPDILPTGPKRRERPDVARARCRVHPVR